MNYVKKERKITKVTGGVATKKKHRFGILSIAVDPVFRSKGLGKKLMDQCEHYAMTKNFDVMDLTVDVNNLPTIQFYDRLGWSKVLSSGGSWLGRMEKHLVNN